MRSNDRYLNASNELQEMPVRNKNFMGKWSTKRCVSNTNLTNYLKIRYIIVDTSHLVTIVALWFCNMQIINLFNLFFRPALLFHVNLMPLCVRTIFSGELKYMTTSFLHIYPFFFAVANLLAPLANNRSFIA